VVDVRKGLKTLGDEASKQTGDREIRRFFERPSPGLLISCNPLSLG
jgi:hypothetical protein